MGLVRSISEIGEAEMKFRKKPVEIEAVQNIGLETNVPPWLQGALHAGIVFWSGGDRGYYTIKTLEGEMRADFGDWIICGIKGEIYPCKPEIFAATYELLS
jgi:hypothetical protein